MAIGRTASSRRLASHGDSLPAGIGRHALLMESSMMEFGRRWFARSKMSTLIQVQRSTRGIRLRILSASGELLEVIIGPESALQMPNAVSGKTIDLRSLRVTSHIVWTLYRIKWNGLSCPRCLLSGFMMCPLLCFVRQWEDEILWVRSSQGRIR